jgi:hypothetical protein
VKARMCPPLSDELTAFIKGLHVSDIGLSLVS